MPRSRQRRGHPRRRARARRCRGARVHAPLRRRRRQPRWPRSRLAPADLRAALDGLPAAQRSALEAAAARIRAFHERQTRPDRAQAGATATPTARCSGQKVDAARPRRHLRAGRQGRLSVERADERAAGQGRRRRRDRHGGADAGRRSATPLVLAAAARGGRRPRLRDRRRAGDRRAGLRHGDDSARCTRSPAPATPTSPSAKRRVFGTVGIDMIAGPERDPGARRRHDAGRLGGDGPVQPGRARRDWRRASCSAPMRRTSIACRKRSSGCCRRCRARR